MRFTRSARQRIARINPWLLITAGVFLCGTMGALYLCGDGTPAVVDVPRPLPEPTERGFHPGNSQGPAIEDGQKERKVDWLSFAKEIPFGKPATPNEADLPAGADLVALARPDWEIDEDADSIALSPDGSFLAVISKRSTISFWEIHTAKRLAVLEAPREAAVWGFRNVAFSADGSLFAVGDIQKVYIFEARTGRKIQELSDPEHEWMSTTVLAPNNETLIARTSKGHVRVWDLKKGAILRTFAEPMEVDIFSRGGLALSPDGKMVAYGAKKALIVAEVATGKITHTRAIDWTCISMTFSPDGKHLAAGGGKAVDVFNLDKFKDDGFSHVTAVDPIYLQYSPSGKTLVAACEFGDVYLFNPADEKQPLRYQIESWGIKRMVGPALSRNGKTLVAAGGKTIRIWDFEAGPYDRRLPQAKRVWAVSGDRRGRSIAVGGEAGIAVYDWKTGEQIHSIPGVDASAITVDPTGRFVAYRHDGPAEIYDLESKTRVNTGCFKPAQIRILDIPRPEDQPLAWSPDGKILAGGESRKVRLYEAGTRKTLGEHRHNVLAVAFSSDSKWLASAGADGKVLVWDLARSSKKWDFDAHEKDVRRLAISADGSLLASGGGKEDPSVSIWDLATGKEKLRWTLHEGDRSLLGAGVTGLSFAPDGKHLALTRGRTNIEIYDVATGKLYRTAPGHTDNPFGTNEAMVDFGDGRFVSFETEKIFLWSWDRLLKTPLALPRPPRAGRVTGPPAFATLQAEYSFEKGTKLLTYAPDGKTLALAAEKQVILANPANGKVLRTLTIDGEGIYHVVFSPDSKTLAMSCDDKSIRIFDIATGTMQRKLVGHAFLPIAMTFALDGAVLVAGNSQLDRQELFFWDVQTGEVRKKFVKDDTKAARSLVALPDDKTVAGICDGKIHFWDVQKHTIVRTIEARKNAAILALSPDGKKLACAEYQDILGFDGGITDAKIWVWDAQSGKVLATIAGTGSQNSMAFGPDGNTIYTVGGDVSKGFSSDYLHAWDIASGKIRASLTHFHQSHNELFGSSSGVTTLAFSPDGKTLATYARSLRLWNAIDLSNEILQKGMVNVIRYSGDAKLQNGVMSLDLAIRGRNSASMLDGIGSLPYPVTLTLRQSEFMSDTAFAHLKGAANIKHLDATGASYLGDAGLKHIGTLTGLETLKLDSPFVTDAGLAHLHALRNLRTVYLYESSATSAGIAGLKKAIPGIKIYE